jgi:hypothetical protein
MLLAAVAITAVALALGAADPRRAGPLRWETDFKAGAEGWTWLPAPGSRLELDGSALLAVFEAGGEQMSVGLAEAPAGDYTFEVAGASATGAAYGLVFGWHDEQHYSAVLVNGNGYAQAWQQAGSRREQWFTWRQWPHLLAGDSNNRVRVDVRGQRVTIRVNDELLVEAEAVVGDLRGQVGVAARSDQAGQAVFSWARLWAPRQ